MKRLKTISLAIYFLAAFVLPGGAEAPYAARETGAANLEEGKKAETLSPGDKFAFDFYRKLAVEGNLFFSPLSAYTAFAMAYEGAAAQTAGEMERVFSFPKDANERRAYFKDLTAGLNFSGENGEMKLANSFWAQKDYPFLPAYLEILSGSYSARAWNLDFKNGTEAARKKINSWAEENTAKKIKNLLPPRSLTALTRLVLVNAVYFKGFWENKFDKKLTYEDLFIKSEKEKKAVMMMKYPGDAKTGYTENEYAKILELPYRGNRFSMILLLPAEGNMKRAEEALTPENFRKWEKELVKTKVRIFLPRFKMEYSASFVKHLSDMGMPTAFTEAADFSGMDGTKKLYIQKALQKAFIEINEEGSEAAAATAVVVGMKSMAISPVFKADRPFIFLIKDKKTNSILFMGKVSDPESK